MYYPPAHTRRPSQPNVDTMVLLSQNLEPTEQFLAHLLRLDADGPAPLVIEMLAGDTISWLNAPRGREEQVCELFKYERKFQRMTVEVSGADALAGLEACHACACGADFVRGFGLGRPTNSLNRNRNLSKVPEGYQEQDLAEASHIALAGADDTMEMFLDIDEADVEVGSIVTTAQRRDLESECDEQGEKRG